MRLCCHLPDRMCWECREEWMKKNDMREQYRFDAALKFLEVKIVIGNPDYKMCWIKFVPDDEKETVRLSKKHCHYKERYKLAFVLSEILTPAHLEAMYHRGNNTAAEIEIGIDPYQEYLYPGCLIRECIPYTDTKIEIRIDGQVIGEGQGVSF